MQQELIIAIFAGLGGMLGWGFADFFAKKTVDTVGSIVSLVWAHVFGTLALSLVLFYKVFVLEETTNIPSDLNTWGLLSLFGGLQAIIYLLLYQAFSKGKLAVINPIFASYSGIAAFLSIAVLGEIVNPYLLLALGVIFSGILLINLDISALRSKSIKLASTPGLKEVLLALILAAVWTVSWDKFVSGKDWLSYALLMYSFMTIVALAISKLQKVSLSITQIGLWKFLILIGLCEAIAYLAISLGFSATSFTSVVALLSGAFSLPTIILARVFLKEKVTSIQTVGSIVIIVGIIILSLR